MDNKEISLIKEGKMIIKRKFLFIILLGYILFFLIFHLPRTLAWDPQGGELDEGPSQRPPIQDPQSVEAQAGNVTELHISGFSTTRTWQGYFGNVSGTIRLADADSNVLYNWTQTNPRGQVYASTNDTITWAYVQCFNFTATGTFDDDTGNAGGTSLYGLNVTQLHERFNIPGYAVDGVNNTFIYQNHDRFYTASLEFLEGQCQTARLFDYSGDGVFQNVLLYEPDTRSVIFTSILEVERLGFDNRTHDFQMIVLDDGRGTDVETTPYYFYIEIE